jgi:hypothetical protein
MHWLSPDISNYTIDDEKEYGDDCWDVTWERLYSHLDVFAFGHFFGWSMKAIIVRHYGIAWSISIMWELTEVRRKIVQWRQCVMSAYLSHVPHIFPGPLREVLVLHCAPP